MRFHAVCLLIAAAGCTGSRWARTDPAYARKYAHHTEDPARVVKQALDARQVAGRSGYYTRTMVSDDPAASDFAVGKLVYPPHLDGAVEASFGLRGSAVEGGGGAGGLELGGRLQTPTRLAPFVGVSVFGGAAPSDYLDALSDDGFNSDEEHTKAAFAVAPEVGVHYWLSPQWRLTASAAQNFAYFEGSNSNEYTSVGLTLAWLDIPGYRSRSARPLPASSCTTEIPIAEFGPQQPLPHPMTASNDTANPYSGLVPPTAPDETP
ncbi:hypothetical protein [Botrimarina colliarenosi]|uniref:hypothetical protein n=1 Tax=Botrimarina colliarenosi TaxID=2528001 RepID=UPI0011B46F04|nr:hypothetical protein [Botrimarina colliarenosi]